MIEVRNIRIMPGRPGRYEDYFVDIRFVDKSLGTYRNEYGLELWNWDKSITLPARDLDYAIECAGNAITEILCRDELNDQT